MESCQARVIEREIDVVLSLLKASEKANAGSPGWQSEDQNVKALWVSAGVLLLAPHGEESMSPSWLEFVLFDSDQRSISRLNASNRP